MNTHSTNIDVSIVIVNYRVKYFLEQTIRSAQEALTGLNGEIIVVDNNSGDDSISHIRECFPEVIIIENDYNAGFGKANNQAFAIAKGNYTLILNPDTIIGEKTIKECIRFYESTEDCGGIGVNMHSGDGFFLPESKRAFPSPWVSFCKIFGLSSLFPKSKTFAKYHLLYLSEDRIHKIEILSGAFIFIKTELLLKIQGFDEDFFMYGEDIDLSYRILKEGYSNYYLPTPIIHYKGESTQKDSYKYVHVFYEAMEIFFRKHSPNYSHFYGLCVRFAINLRATFSLINRFFKKVFPAKASIVTLDRLIIVSNNAERIQNLICVPYKEAIHFTHLKETELPTKGETLIIIDNGDLSYQETIEFIVLHSSDFISYATYMPHSNVIMSPLMDFACLPTK